VVVRATARVTRARVARACLTLPEATSDSATGQHDAYLVRGKKFAYFLDDHHGDGRIALCCRVPEGENTALADAEPKRYFLPPYIGPRGWVGYYLDVANVRWDDVERLVEESYLSVAPKRLRSLVRP
jgi:phosphoribosylglycinamide formyltransferase-1